MKYPKGVVREIGEQVIGRQNVKKCSLKEPCVGINCYVMVLDVWYAFVLLF